MRKNKPMNFIVETENSTKIDRETFLSTLMKNLILAKNKFPKVYVWPESDVLAVFKNLVESLESDTYSRHFHAIQWTLKELKLNNDRKTINQIFRKDG